MNYRNLVMSSKTISLKTIQEEKSTGVIPATPFNGGLGGAASANLVIPHNQGDDHLVFRVMVRVPGSPIFSDWFVAPLTIFDFWVRPSIDSERLYIELTQAGVSLPALNFEYAYRIFVP